MPETVARAARHGLLGRDRPEPAPPETLRAISEQAAYELLVEAETRLGPAARFVVDHVPCRVLLIWPDVAPALTTIPRRPHPGPLHLLGRQSARASDAHYTLLTHGARLPTGAVCWVATSSKQHSTMSSKQRLTMSYGVG